MAACCCQFRMVLTLLVLVASLWTLRFADAQMELMPSGILVVGGSQGNVVDIPTRVGCQELIRCQGNGTTEPLWKRFSLRDPLETGDNRVISLIMMDDADMDGIFVYTSHLLFNPIRLTDSGSFTCTINFQIHTVRLRVEPEPAEVTASNYDISDRNIGTELGVICPVDTCVSDLTVELLRGSEVLDMTTVTDFLGREALFSLNVTESLPGQYRCRVQFSFMGDMLEFSEPFNITGTPMPPVTTQPPLSQSTVPAGRPTGGANRLRVWIVAMVIPALLLPFFTL